MTEYCSKLYEGNDEEQIEEMNTRCPKKIVPRCVATVERLYIQLSQFLHSLHGSSFNLEFETLCESIRNVVADL